MKPLILNADYMIPYQEIPEVNSETEIHFTRFGTNPFPGGIPIFVNNNTKKIFCHVNEPTTSRWTEPISNIIKHHSSYDQIITTNPEILGSCPNSSFMAYGTTWLNKSPHHPDSFGHYTENLSELNKDPSVSMVCGSLQGKTGYNIRHEIYHNRDKIKIEKRFYSSTRFPIPNIEQLPNDDKINLFNSMYSIAIESSQETNYFTEKLIDCLITKTIPVYWGCPNISEFFDTSYWVDISDAINFKYSPEYYYNNIEKINKNCEIAKQYCVNIIERIIGIIK